jgi:hypothetical protein
MKFEIVDGRAILAHRPRPWKYEQLTTLEVGQGLRIPLADLSYKTDHPEHTVRSQASRYGTILGQRLVTRLVPEAILVIRKA